MKRIKEYTLDLLFVTIGSIIFGIGVSVFSAPNNIAPGGLSGVATMLNFVFGTPIGLVVIILNIPIVIWAIVEIGYKLVLKSVAAILISSFAIDTVALFVEPYHGDFVLISLTAGVLEGVGLAIIFTRGITTGGSDMIARVVGKKFRHLSMGNIMLAVDAMVIIVSAFVFGKLESAMYASIVVFVATNIIDAILNGTDVGRGKIFFVFSQKSTEIAERIMVDLDRGVTFLKSRGGFNNDEGEILLCAVRRYEIFKLHEIIREVDKNAFVIAGDASEITGEGFKSSKIDDKTLKELLDKIKKSE